MNGFVISAHTLARFFGILKRFQGIGFIISTDNPITINEYFLFEIRFLWFKFWLTIDL
jgi:hypothetical protein